MQPYDKANIFPLIYRDSSDPERKRAGLDGPDNPISHFTQIVHANTEKVSLLYSRQIFNNCLNMVYRRFLIVTTPKCVFLPFKIGCGFVRTDTNIFVCDYSPPGNIIFNNKPLPAYEVINFFF